MIMRLLYLCLIAVVTFMTMGKAQADRLKDMTSIAGVRSNQLVGYGLVVGLPGTGDGSSTLTLQSMQALISQLGMNTSSIWTLTVRIQLLSLLQLSFLLFPNPASVLTLQFLRSGSQNLCAAAHY